MHINTRWQKSTAHPIGDQGFHVCKKEPTAKRFQTNPNPENPKETFRLSIPCYMTQALTYMFMRCPVSRISVNKNYVKDVYNVTILDVSGQAKKESFF